MIQKAMQWIADLKRASMVPDVLTLPGESNHIKRVYFNNTLEKIELDPLPRNHQLYDLPDLVAAVKLYVGGDAAIYCGRGQITAVMDDDVARRERVRMELPSSEAFKRLTALSQNRSGLPLKAFINLLQIDLAGCVETDVIALFRGISFKKQNDAEAKVSVGKESIGKSINQEVLTGGRDIPEEIAVRISVYEDLAGEELKQTIRCAVRVDFEELTFSLIPLAGELSEAQRATDLWIKEKIQKDLPQVAVLCGRP